MFKLIGKTILVTIVAMLTVVAVLGGIGAVVDTKVHKEDTSVLVPQHA